MPTRVLLVEDDAMISEALGLALADEDFDVTAAATGEGGLDLLESTAVDVVCAARTLSYSNRMMKQQFD